MAYYSEQDDISFTPLTVEEERELFRRFYATGDLAARDEPIKRHLKLVVKLAKTYAKRGLEDEDAIAAGNLGLLQALESRNFEPGRGFRFTSYLRAYVRGSVFAALRARGYEKRGSVEEEQVPCEITVTGRHAECTDIQSHQTSHFNTNSVRKKSWEAETAVDHEFENQQLNSVRRQRIESVLGKLPETEALAIREHYFSEKQFSEIARDHNMTRQAVHQAFQRGWKKLAAALASQREELL